MWHATLHAGKPHVWMPEGVEYLHCVQAAFDEEGLRYQVLDTDGAIRERLSGRCQSPIPHSGGKYRLGETDALFSGHLKSERIVELRLKWRTGTEEVASAQTIFSLFSPGVFAPLWLGLRRLGQTLTLIMGRDPGRSPSYWFGPNLPAGHDFDIHVALCPDMGPEMYSPAATTIPVGHHSWLQQR
jgi:hypothetical protein